MIIKEKNGSTLTNWYHFSKKFHCGAILAPQLGAYWGISTRYLLPHFSHLLPKSTVFCCHIFLICCRNRQYLLPVARSYLLQVAKLPFMASKPVYHEIYRVNFPPNLIVACCGWDFSNCCMLRPKMWQLLQVAAKFPFVARCRIPQYHPTTIFSVLHREMAGCRGEDGADILIKREGRTRNYSPSIQTHGTMEAK